MKTLFLVRHAKSSWEDAELADKDRPLNDRGKRDAPRMAKRVAKRLAKYEVQPDLILSSSAVRALETAKAMAKRIGFRRKAILVDDALYRASVDELLSIVRKLADGASCVMIFGHNPAMAEFVRRLSGEIVRMPTCAVAELRFDVGSWSEIDSAKPLGMTFDYPKRSSRS